MSTILVVDDEPGIRDMLNTALFLEGYDVQTASHGRVALKVIEQKGMPDLIITDFLMPVMDGLGLIDTILHEYGQHQWPMFILMSANSEKPLTHFDDIPVIGKPFNIDVVLATVLRLLMSREQVSA